MHKMILGALVGMLFAASAAPLEIVSPKEGATVPTLTADMKAYLAQPRAERVKQFADPAERKRIAKFGKPIPLEAVPNLKTLSDFGRYC